MDSPRPKYRLQPSVRVAVAGMILFSGILAALLFRAEVPQVGPAGDERDEVVHRESYAPAPDVTTAANTTVPRDARPRLTGTIEDAPIGESHGAPRSAPGAGTSDPSAPADPGNLPPWRAPADSASPPATTVGLVPRDPAGTVYGTRVAEQENRTHRVADGDTLFYLAERYLGDGERYLEIYEANRDVLGDPDVLVIGAVLRIPPPDARRPQSPDEQLAEAAAGGSLVPVTSPLVHPSSSEAQSPGAPRTTLEPPATQGTTASVSIDSTSYTRPTTYRVRAGDTLVDIARRVYGDARRYLEIYEANRDRLKRPQDLREGLILNIP